MPETQETLKRETTSFSAGYILALTADEKIIVAHLSFFMFAFYEGKSPC